MSGLNKIIIAGFYSLGHLLSMDKKKSLEGSIPINAAITENSPRRVSTPGRTDLNSGQHCLDIDGNFTGIAKIVKLQPSKFHKKIVHS